MPSIADAALGKTRLTLTATFALSNPLRVMTLPILAVAGLLADASPPLPVSPVGLLIAASLSSVLVTVGAPQAVRAAANSATASVNLARIRSSVIKVRCAVPSSPAHGRLGAHLDPLVTKLVCACCLKGAGDMSRIQAYTAADLARLRSIHTPPAGGWTNATRDQVREYRDANRRLVQEVLDQLGNRVRRQLPRVRGRWVEVRQVRVKLRAGVLGVGVGREGWL